MRLFYKNYADIATLTEGTQNIYFPVENLQDVDKDKLYKDLGTTTSWSVVFDCLTAIPVTSCILFNHNLTGGETNIKVEGNDTNVWTAPAVSETLTYAADTILKNFTGGSYRYWRITFTKANATDIRSVGRVYLGPSLLARSPDRKGLSVGVTDNATITTTDDGKVFAAAKNIIRNWTIPWSNLLASSGATTLLAIMTDLGAHTPLFFQISTASPLDEVLYAYISGKSYEQVMQGTSSGVYYWGAGMGLREAI
jgi:hypothetical protein